jgi:hypothetical protein
MSTPPRPTGSDAMARWTQWVHDMLAGQRNRICKTSTVSPNYTERGIFLDAAPESGGGMASGVTVKEFKFVQLFGDYMVCQDFRSNPQVNVQIARPFLHRNSRPAEIEYGINYSLTYPQNVSTGIAPNLVWNTLAFLSRSKTSNGVTENQRLTPPPHVGDILRATLLTVPVYGVVSVGPAGGDASNVAGTAIYWMDDNFEGRAWGKTADGNP